MREVRARGAQGCTVDWPDLARANLEQVQTPPASLLSPSDGGRADSCGAVSCACLRRTSNVATYGAFVSWWAVGTLLYIEECGLIGLQLEAPTDPA